MPNFPLIRTLLALATLCGAVASAGAQGLAPLGSSQQAPTSYPAFGPAAMPPQPQPNELPAALPAPVYWGQNVFVIPYQWSSRTDTASATEVVLYASRDRGQHWEEVTRAKADVRSFLYRAQRDGEYWFSVRTIDNAGRMWPVGGHQPELRVIVDTQIPQLRLTEASLDLSGRLQIRCELADANPNGASIQLAAQHTGSPGWNPVAVTLAPNGPNRGLVGIGSWQAPAGTAEVTLRASAQDLAGNPAGAGLVVSATASPSDPMSAPAIAVAPPLGDQTASGDPFLNAPQLSLPGTPAESPTQPAVDQLAQQKTELWPADETSPTPFRADNPGAWRSAAKPRREAVVAAGPMQRPQGNSPFHQASASRGNSRGLHAGPGSSGSDPFLPGDPFPPGNVAEPSSTHPPLSSSVLHVNARRFALDYDLQSVGEWGVSRVEVWGSTDDGETWRQYAIDNDNRSPVDLQVPAAGLYGFRILVQGVGGLPVESPRPGDLPEVQVSVDLDNPQAQIIAAKQGEGYFADHLQIEWQVDDAGLESRPITLLYSNRPSGPWQPVAANLENTGEYSWRLARHLPGAIYVRLEARDRAGNVGADQTSQPVQIHLPEPTGRIQSVRPLGR